MPVETMKNVNAPTPSKHLAVVELDPYLKPYEQVIKAR
jgi:hypothetical protein